MATMAQPFSLFPASVPKIGMPNPHNRQPSLHKIPAVNKVEEIPMLPQPATNADARSRTPSAENIGLAVTTISPIDGTTPTLMCSKPSQKYEPAASNNSSATSPQHTSIGSTSATLVQGPLSEETRSPVVPIQSMFPVYNPAIPLTQQSYYPQRPYPIRLSSIARSNVSRSEYRNSMMTSPIDRDVGIRTAPASVVNFPIDLMSISEPRVSSHRELEKLWEATHGAEPNSLIKSFDLELTRTSEAEFVFGADPGFPFYTLKTYDTNEIAVSKTCPRKRTATRDVVNSTLEPIARRVPPNDCLVSFIFPKLAAMMAITQSSALAKEHNLAPTDKDDIEQAAVRRAAEQEACNVRWNPRHRRYELEHPAIGRNHRDPDFSTSPLSPLLKDSNGLPVLHVTVSTNSAAANASAPPVILVTNPYAMSTPSNSASIGLRLSTLPQSDVDAPLASLDFGSLMLHIDANKILSLMPSLFAIDSVVSAMLAVAVADETTNPFMGAMPLWTPRPRAPGSAFGGSVKSYAGSTYYATIAEREEAEEEATVMRKEHKQDVKKNRRSGKEETQKSWYGKSKKEKTKKKQIVMTEFDLEKLGHYQAGDRKGEKLPGITRGIIHGLVMGLKLIVWMLTVIVQFLTWILVNVSRAVTSEKF